ncbi:MAG: hypothetical protein UR84_C0011G0014 [candidate division WS6 bacterium GW2011_GWD1_35_594]|nr:MAG: hypothetical protein UR84_C0011G0014 [candidate division WS6 bacterium GW2011_GWD1_35_594]
MNITWKNTSSGKLQTPYNNSPTNYKVFSPNLDINIHVLQSEETKSLLIAYNKEGKLIPARLHLGMARVKDLCSATYTIASTKEFKKAINHKYIPKKESISAMLIREPIAQSPFVNTFLGSGFESRLYAVLDVHHVEDKDGVKGLSGKVCTYRIDIPKEKSKEIHNDIKLGILYDSIAGGRNLIAAIDNLKDRFKNIEKFTILSVYASYQGCKRINQHCKELGVECEFFCMHELLNASPLNEYDCFYPEWNITKEDEELLKIFYKEKFRNICMGGDWTANSLGYEQAESVFKMQMNDLGLSKLFN